MIRMPWNNASAPNVMIEVTDACNATCRSCYKKKGQTFKTLEEIDRDLDAGMSLRPLHTVTISGGEPTLHPNLPGIVRLIKKRDVHVFLLTNGITTDSDYLRGLKDSGLDSILFHVDQNQKRPDVEQHGNIGCALERLDNLVDMATRHGLDVSVSATLYEDGLQTLREMSQFFFDRPEITFLYISRGMNPGTPLRASEHSGDSKTDARTGAPSLTDIEAFLDSEFGIEPFAFIPSQDDARVVWQSYFAPVIYNGHRKSTFRIQSNRADLWLMKMQKLMTGRHIHKTTQHPGLTLFRVIVNGITTLRFKELQRFLRLTMNRSTTLRHKMIAYDDGPRLLNDGTIQKCEYCPTAIVRDGQLLSCCTADYPSQSEQEIVKRTTAICRVCAVSHDAAVIRRGSGIDGVVYCPKGEQTYDLSSDAEMYMEITKRSGTQYDDTPPQDMRYALNYISVTNACNLKCTVCGVNAKVDQEHAFYLSADEVVTRALAVRKHGGHILHLFGGEPTIHPELLTIVERISEMGFSVGMVTNGYLLGRDGNLASELKMRGLSRICMQFDSLDEETLNQFGRNYLSEKRSAIRSTLKAGLNLGLNCTVTEHNIGELGNLLAHGLELGCGVKNMTFASAAPVGRYELSSPRSPDRESIVKALLSVGDRFGFGFEDVLPLPAYLPWGTQTHPDCGAHVVLVRTPEGIQSLNRLVDLEVLYRRLGRNRMRRNWVSQYLVPAAHLLGVVRPHKLASFLRTAWGLMTKRTGYSLTNIGISNYRGAMFLDEQRIARCASAFYTSVGPVKACVHFLGDQTAPGSRSQEEFGDKCSLNAV